MLSNVSKRRLATLKRLAEQSGHWPEAVALGPAGTLDQLILPNLEPGHQLDDAYRDDMLANRQETEQVIAGLMGTRLSDATKSYLNYRHALAIERGVWDKIVELGPVDSIDRMIETCPDHPLAHEIRDNIIANRAEAEQFLLDQMGTTSEARR